MRVVVDTATWLSLARSGLLPMLAATPVEPVLLDVVRAEVVDAGLAGDHPDAVAIEAAVSALAVHPAPTAATVDGAVLLMAAQVGWLATSDLALGRRTRALGIRWLRTPDLAVAAARSGGMSMESARWGVIALRDAGRITDALAAAYLEEL